MFHARYSEQRKDVSTHFPAAALGRKGKKVSCDELLCLSFFLFPVPARYACAELRVPTGAGFLFIFFVVGSFFPSYLLLACMDHIAFEPLQEGALVINRAGKHPLP